LDLRPAIVHRRVGIQSAEGFQEIGALRESFEDDYLANRAVKQVMREGLFKSEKYVEFNCNRVMDGLKEFRAWISEFTTLGHMPSQDRLLKQVDQAWHETSGKKKIVVSAPLMLRRLKNLAG